MASRVAELAPGVGCSVAVMAAGMGLADVLGKQLMQLQGLSGVQDREFSFLLLVE